MKKLFILFILLIAFSFPAYSLTKDDIVKLSESGTSSEHIISYIKIKGFTKLSEENIDELVKFGIDNKVIDFIKEHNFEENCKYMNKNETLKEKTVKWLRKKNYRIKD